jgi:hypothetical protein
MNREFDSDLRFEGVILTKSLLLFATGEHPCIVISQPWHRPADPNHPHPSQDEIKEFMKSLGFAEVQGSYFGWCKNQGKIRVVDARSDNFIKTEIGVIPIDLVIGEEL